MSQVTGIEQRLVEVRRRIFQAAARGKREPGTVRLLAVSKNKPVSDIEEAYDAGQRCFAESRVQEWTEKALAMQDRCEWHFVGSLQTNKVKYLRPSLFLIHSLDRFSLLESLNSHGEREGWVWKTLVQVNAARDSAKAGLLPEEVPDFLASVGDHPSVQVLGFMTIGAIDAAPEETREVFRKLRALRDDLHPRKWPGGVDMRELSMGMSDDFETAIEEGATFVRVGRQIFGERLRK